MNKPYLSHKLAFLGTLALGTITATGMATTSAQAAVLGEFNFSSNLTSNFFEDVNPGEPYEFSVTFSPERSASSINTTGLFTPPRGPLPLATRLNPSRLSVGKTRDNQPSNVATATFEWMQTFDDGSFEYKLVDNDPLRLTFFESSSPEGFVEEFVTVAYRPGDTFLGRFLNGDVIFEQRNVNPGVLISDPSSIDVRSFSGPSVRDEFRFGVSVGTSNGSYFGEVQILSTVPEPAAIIGVLTIGALGFGLKRKKQP